MYYISIFLIVFGVYMISLERLKLPTMQTSKEIIAFYNQGKTQSKLEIFLDDLASKISGMIRLDNYKKKKLETKLDIAGIYKTPEKYIAENYIKSFIPLVIAVPLYLVFPIMLPIILLISVRTYLKNANRLDRDLKIVREKIEYELPRFTRDIAEYLKSDRNVLLILERYKNTAGENLKRELEITIRDMKTGNYEMSLTRFEIRVQSPMLSEIVRGLISVIRGDDAQIYFQILAENFKAEERERLKAEALKRPDKIKKYSAMLLISMVLMYIVILIIAVIQNIGGMA